MSKEKPTLVQYYASGWRYGYLVKQGYKWTRIKRILPVGVTATKRGMRAGFVTVATADVREV